MQGRVLTGVSWLALVAACAMFVLGCAAGEPARPPGGSGSAGAGDHDASAPVDGGGGAAPAGAAGAAGAPGGVAGAGGGGGAGAGGGAAAGAPPPDSCETIPGTPRPLAIPEAVTVAVDPTPAALADAQTVGDWTADLAGWTVKGGAAAVQGGALVVTGAGAPASVERQGLTAIDLDRGFRDYVDVRATVAAGFAGDLEISYATTAQPAFGADRRFRIPGAALRADGKPHLYRLDVGPEQRWRGTLAGLRIATTGPLPAGATVAIDFVKVGDVDGDVNLVQSDDTVKGLPSLQSKHFTVYYAEADYPAAKVPVTLRNLEEMWQFYRKILKIADPCQLGPGGKPVKITVKIAKDSCFACAGGTGMGLQPSAAEADPPSWAIAHELMHNFQSTNAGIDGQYWENNANYGRERYIYWYANLFGDVSNLEAFYAASASWDHGNGRHYYLSWPIYLYMDENPDGIAGLGDGTMGKVWVETKKAESLYTALQRVVGGAVSVQDIVGYMARRNATWSYSHQKALAKGATTGDADILAGWVHAQLRRRPDDPAWWQVPPEAAPMQTGYAVHELVPDAGAGAVTVQFRGLRDAAAKAGWRAALVVVAKDGSERYSTLFSSGSACAKLGPDTDKVYLTVAGTPDQFSFITWMDDAFPYQSHPGKARMLYEVSVTGASPAESRPAPVGAGKPHPNGGGFVAATAQVDATAYVGPNALVLGGAKVLGSARVEDFAVVKDAAQVSESAVVSGHAVVRGSASVRGAAKVRDFAIVGDRAVVEDHARVLEHATVVSFGHLSGRVTVKGKAQAEEPQNDPRFAGGDAVLDGDYNAAYTVTNGFQFGFVPYNGTLKEWIDARKAPAALYAAYRFDKPHESLAKDAFGTTDGYLVGNPAWQAGTPPIAGSYTLDGKSQYVLLDRQLSDFDAVTMGVWVKLDALGAAQPVAYFGGAADRYLALTVGGDGTPRLDVVSGSTKEQVTGTTKLVAGRWVLLALTLDGARGRLYVGGTAAGDAPVTTRPDQLLAPNTSRDAQASYLGRDAGAGRLAGALGGFFVYGGALDAARVAALAAGTL